MKIGNNNIRNKQNLKLVKRKWNGTIGLLLMVWLVSACSTTKHLPEGEILYTGIKKITITNKDKSPAGTKTLEEVNAAISVAPNNSVLGSASLRTPFPMGLWIYNGFKKYEKGFGNWIFRKLAADPVLMSTVNPSTRAKIGTNLLHDYGFFNGEVNYSIVETKDPKKQKVSYQIDMGKPYCYDSIYYEGFDKKADSLIFARFNERIIRPGDHFDVTLLNEERDRLVKLFRNHGYYYYRSDFITFLADTIQRPGYVNLKIVPQKNILAEGLRTYRLGKTTIHMVGYKGEQPTDSIVYGDFTIHYAGKKPGVKYGVLRRRFLYEEGMEYSQGRMDYTQEGLSRLGVFKYNEVTYEPRGNSDTLDLRVNTMFDLPYDSELEFNVVTKSTEQTGPGAIFKLSKKNFQRMGASLNLELKGSYEWQTSSTVEGNSSVMNSYEIGATLSLEFPRLILPWKPKRKDARFYPQQTDFKIYANQLNRARYFKMLSFGGDATYSWQPKRYLRHSVTPLSLAFSTLQHKTAEFDSIASQNPMLFHSLDDQFIPSLKYSITYDNGYLKKRNRIWWNNSITSSGNITSLIYAAFGKKFDEKNKKLLGTPFAQFLKFSSEFRHTYHFNEKHQLATRIIGGIIWAYGNKQIAPYSEQFYVGGANSIRAFTIRSLGPGRFHPAQDAKYTYVDETGDIKLEANIEYRFRLLSNCLGGNLNGAIFLDAGNVWLLREDPSRPESQFTLKKFFDSIALGTGVGIRYDLSFLILRLDCGIGLHVPYETSKKGYYNIPKFKDGLGIHFAIGYPF